MITKQKIVLIISIALIFLIGLSIFNLWTPEEKNVKNYTQALDEYNNNVFSEAYSNFGKVSRFSKLKSAAIYRQALCADKLGDEKTTLKKYKELIKRYPDSKLSMRAKYLKAQLLYKDKNTKKAKKEFKTIIKKYPKTDYAIASEYFLGSIEADYATKIKNPKKKVRVANKAAHCFRAYLTEAPSGRYSINSIEKWTGLKTKLTNEENLLIAKSYQANQDYKKAQKYLNYTNISSSWPYFIKNAYALKDYPKVKYYTELGLKTNPDDAIAINEKANAETENKNIYEAIDTYLKISDSNKTSISYLLSKARNAKGYEYLLYKNCKNLPANFQLACYNNLYLKYPEGQFAAETLANIFYEKIKSNDYFTAKKIGKKHLAKFSGSNSAPKIMFWLAKIAERTKNYEEARSYYRSLISNYPDDYYAYHAYINLNKFKHPTIDPNNLENKPVLFPYKKTPQNEIIIQLAEVKDYGLINELCKDDDFVQSWLKYKQGNFSTSATMARDAMEKLKRKPDKTDLRWRLVYPVHYYKEIEKNALPLNNSPILILSIIREESYFNPKIKSFVGACGLMQLMPSTAREIGHRYGINIDSEASLLKPETNIKLGNMYYAQLRRSLLNRDALAVLAYNGGIGSVLSWKEKLNYTDIDDFVEQIPYAETQNYLKKVYRSYWNYIRIYSPE